MSNLLAECRALILQLAPELADQPLYLADADLFRDLPCNNGCTLGWADCSPIINRNLIDRLGERYSGPGPVIAIDLAAIEAQAQPGALARCAANVCLHEGAHVLPTKQVFEPADSTFAREWQAARMTDDFTAPEAKPGSFQDDHDWRFIRRATHLAYRALIARVDVTLDWLYGPQTWMSRPESYLSALLPECHAMTAATFGEIEQAEPPAAFTQLWQADLGYFRKREFWKTK